MSSDGPTGRFLRSDRLLDSRDFRRVLRRGRRRAAPDLVVVTARRTPTDEPETGQASAASAATGTSRSRLGITASRKVGNAVVRNRFKRRVREWFRRHRDEFPEGLDLVVIARREGAQLPFDALSRRLGALLGLDSARGAAS